MIQKISLLGTLEVVNDGHPADITKSARGSALLAYLLLTRQTHARESLAALLWDGPSTADTLRYLRKLLHRARPLLPRLEVTRQQVAYHTDNSVHVDLYALEAALGSGDVTQMDEALRLYRGELLCGFYLEGATGFTEWLAVERERLRLRVSDGYRRVCAAYEAQHAWPQGIDAARRWLTLDDLEEESHRQLMRLLVADGQLSAAKEQYAYCRRQLWAQLQVEPEPITVDLYEQILAIGQQLPAHANHPLVVDSHRHWGEAPSAGPFFGRAAELAQLSQRLTNDPAHVIAILGIGGQGKTSLAATVVRAHADQFATVYWRSLINAPPADMMMHDYLSFLSGYATVPPDGIAAKVAEIHRHLQQRRHVLVLDNLDTILDAERVGHFRRGYEAYEQLLRLFANGGHRSTLLATSREAPLLLTNLEGHASNVTMMALAGLTVDDNTNLLAAQAIDASRDTVTTLTARYSGNPLALQLVAQTVDEFYFGDVETFLTEETLMFEDIRNVLDSQFARLSPLEQEIMLWLAITREATDPTALVNLMLRPASRTQLLDAMKRLQRRSLLARERLGFTLQNVVIEYLTACFIDQIADELSSGKLKWLHSHALILAQAKEYIRHSQERLILQPVAERLRAELGQSGFHAQAMRLIAQMRNASSPEPGYAPGSLLNLLRYLDVDISGDDFSQLPVRQANLRGWTLHDVDFSRASFSSTLFTASFGIPHSVAIHPEGHLLAGGTELGEVRLWTMADARPARVLAGHTKRVSCVAFSPDGRLLASSSLDDTLRLWELHTGDTPRILQLPDQGGGALAFSPDGRTLASGGKDGRISLWDVASGRTIAQIESHVRWVYALAFSPQGNLLACSGRPAFVYLWELSTLNQMRSKGESNPAPIEPVGTLRTAHAPVPSLAFNPDGTLLAAGSGGYVTEVWDARDSPSVERQPIWTFHGDRSWIRAIAMNPDARTMASGSGEGLIYLSDLQSGRRLDVLTGHHHFINSLAFDPEGSTLVSASEDNTVRMWSRSDSGQWQLSAILQSHTPASRTVAFSPDGTILAVGDTKGLIHLWHGDHTDVAACRYQILSGHTSSVQGVAFRPDGQLLASISVDRTIRIWQLQPAEGNGPQCVDILAEYDKEMWAVSFSADGRYLYTSCGDGIVRIWLIDDAGQTQPYRMLQRDVVAVVDVAMHPSGGYLIESSYAGRPHLWDFEAGKQIAELQEFRDVTSLAYSADGDLLIASSRDGLIGIWDASQPTNVRLLDISSSCHSTIWHISLAPNAAWVAGACEDGAIRLWVLHDVGTPRALLGHKGAAFAVAFRPDGKILASGGSDGTVRLWEPSTGACVNTLQLPGPYEGMNIRDVTDITEVQREALKTLGAVDK